MFMAGPGQDDESPYPWPQHTYYCLQPPADFPEFVVDCDSEGHKPRSGRVSVLSPVPSRAHRGCDHGCELLCRLDRLPFLPEGNDRPGNPPCLPPSTQKREDLEKLFHRVVIDDFGYVRSRLPGIHLHGEPRTVEGEAAPGIEQLITGEARV